MGTEISIKGASVNPTTSFLPYNNSGIFSDSGFYYNNGSLDALYHKGLDDFGNAGHNFIADTDSGVYQLGMLPNGIGWPNPQTGIKFDYFNNIFNITCGSAYNAKFSVSGGQTMVQGGDMGAGFMQMNDWGSSLSNYQGTVTLNGNNGVSLFGNFGEVYMVAERVNMQAYDKVIFQTANIKFADYTIFETGTKTQTNRYLKILDENGVAYYLPLYQ